MKDEINLKLINSLKQVPTTRDTEIWDIKIEGFVLRKRPSGKMFYYFCYTDNSKLERMKLGEVDITSLEYARDRARELRGQLAIGIYPKALQKQAELAQQAQLAETAREKTYLQFLIEIYRPYLEQRPKGRPHEIYRTLYNFTHLHNMKLADITAGDLEQWRTQRRSGGIKESTINRELNDLRAAFNMAVNTWELLNTSPVHKIKPGKVDNKGNVRFLSEAEESRLRAALAARDEQMHDYLLPFVLTALGTGCRLGELIALQWKNVDYANRMITIRGETSKSSSTRHVPISNEVLAVLKHWEKQPRVANIDGHVFTHADGRPLGNIHKAWQNLLIKAKVKNFRFHDLRHTCASKMAMAGVSLVVIKEILGHSDFKLTSRYSHLSNETMLNAVNAVAKVASN